MSKTSGDAEHLAFRQQLIDNAKLAERAYIPRLQWNMWSKHDPAVPGDCGRLTSEPSRQYEVSGVGHYGPMFSLRMLLKMRSWVREMYALERGVNSGMGIELTSLKAAGMGA